MAQNIRDIAIRLSAQTESLRRELERAEREVQKNTSGMGRAVGKFDRDLKRLNKTASQTWAKLAVGAVAAQRGTRWLLSFTNGALASADGLQRQAEKLGISTTALQEYRFAGQDANVAITAVDMGLQRFLRRAGEFARTGRGELAPVFEQLGISLKDQNGRLKSAEDLLDEYADAIKGASSDMERLSLAQKAFDSEGVAMVNVLRDGAEGLERARQKAHEFGAVLDADLVKRASQSKSELDLLQLGISTTFQAALLEPFLEKFGDFEVALLETRALADDFGEVAGKAFIFAGEAAGFLAKHAETVEGVLALVAGARLGAVFGPWGVAAGALGGVLVSLSDNLFEVTTTADDQKRVVNELSQAYQRAARDGSTFAQSQLKIAQNQVRSQIGDLQALRAETLRTLGDATRGGSESTVAALEAELVSLDRQILNLEVSLGGLIPVTARVRQGFSDTGDEVVRTNTSIETSVRTIIAQVNALRIGGLDELYKTEDLQKAEKLYEQLSENTHLTLEDVIELVRQERLLSEERDNLIASIRDEQNEREALSQKTQDQHRAAAEMVAEMETELAVLRLQRDGHADLADEVLFEAQARKVLGAAYDENAEQLEDLRAAIAAVKDEIEAQTEEQEALAESARQAALAMQEIWNEAARGVFTTWRDGWRDLLAGKIDDFDDFAKRILDIGLDLAANLIAAQTFGPVFGGAFASAAGVPGGGGVLGTASSVGSIFSGASSLSSLFSLGSASLLTASPLSGLVYSGLGQSLGLSAGINATGAGSTLLGMTSLQGLGPAALGYGLGSLLMTPRRGPGNEIGAGIGGAAGFAFGGSVGAFLGSTLGSLVGGLFGAKPSDRLEGTIFDVGTGSRDEFDLGRGKDDPENRAAVNAFIDAAASLIGTLEGITGGAVGVSEIGFQVGDRSGVTLSIDDAISETFDTVEDAFGFLTEHVVAHLENITPEIEAALSGIDFTDVEAGLAALGDALDAINAQAAAEAFAQSIEDRILALEDPEQFALNQLDATFDALRAQATENGQDLVRIEHLYGLERARVVERFNDEIEETFEEVEDAAGDAADALAAMAAAQSYVEETVIGFMEERLDLLGEEARLLQDQAALWGGVQQSARATLQRLKFDEGLSFLSGEERALQTMAELEAAFAAAQAGDEEAAAGLSDLALLAAEANRAFFATSAEGAKNDERIRQILGSVDNLAADELRIANENLRANQEAVELLRQQIAAVGALNDAPSRSSFTPADLDALTAAFGAAQAEAVAGGMSLQQFVGGSLFAQFESELVRMINGLTDRQRLLDDLAVQRGREGDPIYGDSAGRIRAAIENRLSALGVPGYDIGGLTGRVAEVHRGELLYTGPPARVLNRADSLRAMNGSAGELRDVVRQLEIVSRTVSIAGEDQVGALKTIGARLARIEGNLELAAAR